MQTRNKASSRHRMLTTRDDSVGPLCVGLTGTMYVEAGTESGYVEDGVVGSYVNQYHFLRRALKMGRIYGRVEKRQRVEECSPLG